MKKKYCCVKRSTTILANSVSPITLSEFRVAVNSNKDVLWSVDPGGSVEVITSSKGDSINLPVYEGFIFNKKFILCYEFSQGIAVHLYDHESLKLIIEKLANELNASVFHL